ncbi:MAG: hypothetical protein WKF36_04990 [Candidatus Nitrosocosmicus sp.]
MQLRGRSSNRWGRAATDETQPVAPNATLTDETQQQPMRTQPQ